MWLSTSKKANVSFGNETVSTFLKLIISEILVSFTKDMLYPHNKLDARFLAINHVMLIYGACSSFFL
jgi:hypothetical protein